ncbi:MAG TPA: hypothetical protein VK928_07025 [Longimicrobiales bacterium]|nr:hypothetical protein [Longimicrobiales bacterium]
MEIERKYRWESYEEYVAQQQFNRCLGAVLASLPRRQRNRVGPPLIKASVLAGMMFTLAHSEDDEEQVLAAESRADARTAALGFVTDLRDRLAGLTGRASAPHLTAALELLERFEAGVRDRPLPPTPNLPDMEWQA